MDKSKRDKLQRMIKAQSEMERQDHNSLRPLQNIIIHLECGCNIPIGSDPQLAPRAGMPLWCFTHMAAIPVTWVEWVR